MTATGSSFILPRTLRNPSSSRQWNDEEYDLQHVKEELADVIVYSQNLLDKLGLDADEIVNMKMGMNERKYPVEKAKGKSAKYDCL